MGNIGFNNIGKSVSDERIKKGIAELKQMWIDVSNEESFFIIECVKLHIERGTVNCVISSSPDNEHLRKLDLTGRYRLLASMLTD